MKNLIGMVAFATVALLLLGREVAQAVVPAGSGQLELVGRTACKRLDTSTTAATVTLAKGRRYRAIGTTARHAYGVGFTPADPATCTSDSNCGVELPPDVPEEFAFDFSNAGSDPVVSVRTATGTGRIQFCLVQDAR
ncbi:MAG: hypothetical protein ACK4N5_17985 [Myxococcales bacterium]